VICAFTGIPTAHDRDNNKKKQQMSTSNELPGKYF
jgi:hypothetical protein